MTRDWMPQGPAANENVATPDFAFLARTIHADNVIAGWWNDLKTGESIIYKRNRPEMLMLGVSELGEAYDGVIDGCQDDKLPHLSMFDVELADFEIRQLDQIGAEVAAGNAEMPEFSLRPLPARLAFKSKVEQLMHLVSILAKAMEHYRKGRTQEYVDMMGYGVTQCFALAMLHGIPLIDVMDQKRAFNKNRADHKIENRLAVGGKAF